MPERIEEQIGDIPVPPIVEDTVEWCKFFFMSVILRWSTSRQHHQCPTHCPVSRYLQHTPWTLPVFRARDVLPQLWRPRALRSNPKLATLASTKMGHRAKSSALALDCITVTRSGFSTPGNAGDMSLAVGCDAATSPQASTDTMPNAGGFDCGRCTGWLPPAWGGIQVPGTGSSPVASPCSRPVSLSASTSWSTSSIFVQSPVLDRQPDAPWRMWGLFPVLTVTIEKLSYIDLGYDKNLCLRRVATAATSLVDKSNGH